MLRDGDPGLGDDAPLPRTNPFLIALGVVAAALIGGGLYLVSRMRDLFASTQGETDFDFITLQILVGLAPLILCLGIATGIGMLFIFAVRWGHPRSPVTSVRQRMSTADSAAAPAQLLVARGPHRGTAP